MLQPVGGVVTFFFLLSKPSSFSWSAAFLFCFYAKTKEKNVSNDKFAVFNRYHLLTIVCCDCRYTSIFTCLGVK
uniref:Putative secreted protein n=1 Tax=Psorophora albipes TaxID=869069 RepID=T1DJD4_9DIPT